MNFDRLIQLILPFGESTSVDRLELSFAAPWAQGRPGRVVLGCVALTIVSAWLYLRGQKRGRTWMRAVLAAVRAIVLCLLLVFLADPVATAKLTQSHKPWLWLLFDGSDSMAIEDDHTEADLSRLRDAVGLNGNAGAGGTGKISRAACVQALLQKPDENFVRELGTKYRLKAFIFDRPDGVRELALDDPDNLQAAPEKWAEQLVTTGEVTALGRAFEDLAVRPAAGQLGGVLVFSDHDQNSGPPAAAAARRLGVPVYTVGIGATAAVDLALDVQAPLLLKKAERAEITVTLRNMGLAGQTASVRLSAAPISSDGAPGEREPRAIAEKSVTLTDADQPVEITWIPQETGRYRLIAHVDPLPGELVTENNTFEREVQVRDEFLRLMFVENEPTWEWRFIKEVFHRDRLVGIRGFRTYLRSADPAVRRTNELFLSTLAPRRSEFFAYDVIFLGDMPAAAYSPRFFEMTREFVSQFGGGLVVLSGPRFGPGELAGTPLADMLPITADAGARPRDAKSFVLRITPEAAAYDFMRLGSSDRENAKAWANLGPLPWYQPANRMHPLATALAVHPTDVCADGKTPQPIIAVRRFGRGEVVYLAFDETWRLRRRYGEEYYRQFWGQMIHRLGLSHALGSQKRFVVRTDRQAYQPDDEVVVTVEAFNANYEPLSENDLPDRALHAELVLPAGSGQVRTPPQQLKLPQSRPGVFEARVPVLTPGEHRLSVTDPVTNERSDLFFRVASVSVERRSAVRNVALEREIAQATGGRSYDLTTVNEFLRDFNPAQRVETSVKTLSAWNTWPAFLLVVLLLLLEWLVRKLVSLP